MLTSQGRRCFQLSAPQTHRLRPDRWRGERRSRLPSGTCLSSPVLRPWVPAGWRMAGCRVNRARRQHHRDCSMALGSFVSPSTSSQALSRVSTGVRPSRTTIPASSFGSGPWQCGSSQRLETRRGPGLRNSDRQHRQESGCGSEHLWGSAPPYRLGLQAGAGCDACFAAGQWNSYEITAQGTKLR
jgi:hypothetical protein